MHVQIVHVEIEMVIIAMFGYVLNQHLKILPAVVIFLNLLADFSPPHSSIRARWEFKISIHIVCMFRSA